MRLRVFEDVNNNDTEYGVLVTDLNGKVCVACFYNDKTSAYEFINDAETMGRSVFDRWDVDILSKPTDYEPDSYGNCYYHATTADGREYLQRVKILNSEPINFN